MKQKTLRAPDRVPIVVGVILLASAVIVGLDASHIQSGFTYGISPAAIPYVVAALLAVLGLCHFIAAFRRREPTADPTTWPSEPADWKAVALMVTGLFALMASVAFGGGFILGSSLLFALTARSFGRKAFLADFAIGVVLAIVIFLVFNNLLSLTLPEGPIERLL